MAGRINLVEDIVSAGAVTVVDVLAQKSSSMVLGMTAQELANYVMAGGGGLAAYMGWGGKYNSYLEKIAIAAAPGALVALYNKIAHPAQPASISGGYRTAGRPMSMRVSRYPGPAAETPFNGVRLV